MAKEDQRLGICTTPHGLSFDKDGNLYVEDGNVTDRVTELSKPSGGISPQLGIFRVQFAKNGAYPRYESVRAATGETKSR